MSGTKLGHLEFNRAQSALERVINAANDNVLPPDVELGLLGLHKYADNIINPTFAADVKPRAATKYLKVKEQLSAASLAPDVKTEVDVIHAYIDQHHKPLLEAAANAEIQR